VVAGGRYIGSLPLRYCQARMGPCIYRLVSNYWKSHLAWVTNVVVASCYKGSEVFGNGVDTNMELLFVKLDNCNRICEKGSYSLSKFLTLTDHN